MRPYHHYVAWKYEDMEGARSRTGPAPAPPTLSAGLERDLRESIVLGRPEEVAERIRDLADAAGGDLHYIARLYWPGMDPGLQRETVELFGEAVAPMLR